MRETFGKNVMDFFKMWCRKHALRNESAAKINRLFRLFSHLHKNWNFLFLALTVFVPLCIVENSKLFNIFVPNSSAKIDIILINFHYN